MSNHIKLDESQCLVPTVMHVDPLMSLTECKKDISQKHSGLRKLEFGNDWFRIFEVASEKVHYIIDLIRNNYAYKVSDPLAGRAHKQYTASLTNINFQKPQTTADFNDFKNRYQKYTGDYLKSQILEDLKKQIQDTSSKEELDALKEKVKTSYEYDVLKTGQGWFTQTFGIKTSSVDALDSMFEQQEMYLYNTDPKSPN